MNSLAIDTDQAKTIGIGLIIGVVVIGGLISALVAKMVGRIIVIVLALGLALVVYAQRSGIESAAKNCDATFFGVHLTPSNPQLKQQCIDRQK